MTLTPLEDPSYTPQHPPIKGTVPPVVAKWGVKSQRRWFRRYWMQLNPQREEYWAQFHCDSEHHLGTCCVSCVNEANDGYPPYDDVCCCNARNV